MRKKGESLRSNQTDPVRAAEGEQRHATPCNAMQHREAEGANRRNKPRAETGTPGQKRGHHSLSRHKPKKNETEHK